MAIKAIAYPRQSSGQYLIERAFTTSKPLRELGWNIQLRWIPAHIGILGNEEADKAVKEAARWRPRQPYTSPSEEIEHPDYLYPKTAAINTVVRDARRKKWISLAKRNERIPRRRFTLEPTKKVLTLHKATHRLISSVIIQLRTSRIGLRDFVHEKKVSGFRFRRPSISVRTRGADGATYPHKRQKFQRSNRDDVDNRVGI